MGIYLDDERQGVGEMIWTDGSRYRGLWNAGIQHGVGIMYFTDGSKRAGIFANNVFKCNIKTKETLDLYKEKLDEELFAEIEENMHERGGKNVASGLLHQNSGNNLNSE